MAKSIEIDRKKRLRDEPHKGHNRWHPDIVPVIEAAPGEEVTLETRDANDLQIHAGTTARDLEKLEHTVVHPLTGPVYVKGAEPGDLLEIEYLDIAPQRYGWTRFAPGRGFLPDLFDHHFVAHWDITPEYATSPQLPGVRIPNGAFMGTAGVAPSHEQLRRWSARSIPWATGTTRRAIRSAAAPRSRWVLRRPSGFGFIVEKQLQRRSSGRAFRTRASFRIRSTACRATSSPPWACRSRTRAATRVAISHWRQETR
jgi:acetamidase/formamidase